MSAEVVKLVEGGLLRFFCPGCKESHTIEVGSDSGRPTWTYNGNPVNPTFQPSVLVKTGHYVTDRAHEGCWCTYYQEHPEDKRDYECRQCHSFVTDGQIQFLSDCSHELAKLTVPLPAWPSDKEY